MNGNTFNLPNRGPAISIFGQHYQRPDLKVVLESLRRSRLRLRLAMSSGSAARAVDELIGCWSRYQYQREIAQLRHEQQTRDPFFLAEVEFFAAADCDMQISLTGALQALSSCRFRDDIAPSIDLDLLTVAQRLADQMTERVREDCQAENLLNLKLRDWAAQSRVFCLGQHWSLFALPSLLESPQRSIRRTALRGIDDFLMAHADGLDLLIGQIIELRQQIARKQRQPDVYDRACQQVGLSELTAENRAVFRDQVIKYFVPMAAEVRRLQRKRFGFDQLQDYDLLCLIPQGHPVPSIIRESLLQATGEILGDLSESGDLTSGSNRIRSLFTSSTADFMLRPDMRGDDHAVTLDDQGQTYWRLIQHGTMADISHQLHSAGRLIGSMDWPFPESADESIKHPHLPDIARSSLQGYLTELATLGRLKSIISDPELYALLRLTQLVETIVWKTMIDDFSGRIVEQAVFDPDNWRRLWLELEQVYVPDIFHDSTPFLSKGGLMYLTIESWIQPGQSIAQAFGLISALGIWKGAVRKPFKMDQAWRDLMLRGSRTPYFQLISELGQPMPWDETLIKQLAFSVSSFLTL